jgi:type III secretion protein Q
MRRASSQAATLRVVSTGPAQALEADFVRDPSQILALSLTVLVGDEAYASRLLLRRASPFAARASAWTMRRLASLGAVSLSLPIVACATLARAADVAALRAGDAWLPGSWPLELEREAGPGRGALRGPVLLAAPGAAVGLRARLVDAGRLVLSGEVDAVCAGEAEMTESDGESALLEAVGDVPVIVRVEIGEARMAARDWASLGRGDVVTLGRRVGELVLLRVGGVAVARGELVSVDGEVGVRIAERIAGDSTSA